MGVEESYVAGLGKSMCVEIGYWVSLGKKIHGASCFRVAHNPSRVDAQRGDHSPQADLNEAARAADASREVNGAVYGERLR
jgi:hypothetical protein